MDQSAKHCVSSSTTSSPAADLAAEQKQAGNMQGGKCALGGEGVARGWMGGRGSGAVWGGGGGAFLCAATLTDLLQIGI